ncbi:MAG: hypothetical protein ACREPW_05385 [Candidatus Binataceae bacterium]
MQAQTLQKVWPVSDGEFFSALAGEFDASVPGGCPALDAPDVVLAGAALALLSPGDCPGGMNGDCGVLVRYAIQAPEAAERAAV